MEDLSGSTSATKLGRAVSNLGMCVAGDSSLILSNLEYTILTFIPKNLYEQFRRVANLYFLGLVCIQGTVHSILIFRYGIWN
jgi:hypothetical protein